MGVHTVVLTVGLKITDNEARSALEALRVKMGLGEAVRSLAREERWQLGVEAPTSAEAEAVVAGLVRATNLFANPNKHCHAIGSGVDLAPDEVAILVTDREGADGASILTTLHRLGASSVTCIARSARWRVGLAEAPRPDDPAILELLRDIGVTESRSVGLLANPHSQTVRVLFPSGEEKPLV